MSKPLRLGLTFAAIAGLLFVIGCFISLVADFETVNRANTFLGQIIFFIGLFYTINSVRTHEGQGLLSFKTGFGVGMQYTSVFSIVISLFVITQFIIPNYLNHFMEVSQAKAAKAYQKLSAAEIDKIISQFKIDYTPFKTYTTSVFVFMMTGFVFSIIISVLLRSKK